jgi:hypothetical protein
VTRRPVEEELQDFARLQVRADLLPPEEQQREVRDAVAAEMSGMPGADADILARAWLAGARKQALAEQASWPAVTDHDRLEAAFAECEAHGVRVLRGVEDHWQAKAELEAHGAALRGVVWFTHPDVWHAVDEGMLELNLWHASGANAAPGDHLLDAVVSCLGRHGLQAHFDEGRIEVAAHWHKRI